MHISMLSTNIIFSTLDRLDRFVIQYNITVMHPLENYKFVDFVRTFTLGMLTTAIHIELFMISLSRCKVARLLSLTSLDSRYTDNQDNLFTFKSE